MRGLGTRDGEIRSLRSINLIRVVPEQASEGLLRIRISSLVYYVYHSFRCCGLLVTTHVFVRRETELQILDRTTSLGYSVHLRVINIIN